MEKITGIEGGDPLSPVEQLMFAAADAEFRQKQGAEWKKKFGYLLEGLPEKFRTRNGLQLHLALAAKSSDTVLTYKQLWDELEVIGYETYATDELARTDITCECGKPHIRHEVIVRNINNASLTCLGTSCAVRGGLHVPKEFRP